MLPCFLMHFLLLTASLAIMCFLNSLTICSIFCYFTIKTFLCVFLTPVTLVRTMPFTADINPAAKSCAGFVSIAVNFKILKMGFLSKVFQVACTLCNLTLFIYIQFYLINCWPVTPMSIASRCIGAKYYLQH